VATPRTSRAHQTHGTRVATATETAQEKQEKILMQNTDTTASSPATAIIPAPAKPKVPGGFVPGDRRINRKGRPRAYTALRETILDFLAEQDDAGSRTRLDVILRCLLRKDPAVLLEYAYGKPPTKIEHAGVDAVLVLHAHQMEAKPVTVTENENHPANITPGADSNR